MHKDFNHIIENNKHSSNGYTKNCTDGITEPLSANNDKNQGGILHYQMSTIVE